MHELTAEERALLKTILSKRQASIPLDDKEEAFARKLFDEIVSSKKTFAKTLKVVTGDELRKSKTDAAPTRSAPPVYPYVQHVERIQSDSPTAQPDESARGGEKVADADNAPKTLKTENQRLSDILQDNVDWPTPPPVQPQAKSAEPIRIGDHVIKEGARIAYGTILALDSQGHALVKWLDGRQTYEAARELVKVASEGPVRSDKDTLLPEGKPAKKPGGDGEEPYTPPVKKAEKEREMTDEELEAAEQLAEDLKGKEDIDNPHALARWMVQQHGPGVGEKLADGSVDLAKAVEGFKKDGDLVAEPGANVPAPVSPETPFEGLVRTLECVLDLARTIKHYQETAAHDEEVVEYYDGILDELRGIAENILAALSMELEEAQAKQE